MINAITTGVQNTTDHQLISAINALIVAHDLAEKDHFFVVKVKGNVLQIAPDTDSTGQLVDPYTVTVPGVKEAMKYYLGLNETGNFTLMLPEEY